jgi:hypothetical protein
VTLRLRPQRREEAVFELRDLGRDVGFVRVRLVEAVPQLLKLGDERLQRIGQRTKYGLSAGLHAVAKHAEVRLACARRAEHRLQLVAEHLAQRGILLAPLLFAFIGCGDHRVGGRALQKIKTRQGVLDRADCPKDAHDGSQCWDEHLEAEGGFDRLARSLRGAHDRMKPVRHLRHGERSGRDLQPHHQPVRDLLLHLGREVLEEHDRLAESRVRLLQRGFESLPDF